MNRATFLDYIKKLEKKGNEILQKKSHDYSKKEDVFRNFKNVSFLLKTLSIDTYTPEGYCLMLLLLKIDRLSNLLFSSKQPENESIEDTIIDMINYAKLLAGILKERGRI